MEGKAPLFLIEVSQVKAARDVRPLFQPIVKCRFMEVQTAVGGAGSRHLIGDHF